MSSIHILSVLLAGGTATLSLLLGTAAADCLVEGDMVFVEGQSTGHLGLECLNSTHYDAVDTVCGPDEVLIEIDAVYACPAPDPASDPFGLYAAPYCVQCGPRGPGSALCLVAPEVPSYCASGATGGGDAGTDDEEEGGEEDFLPAETTTATATMAMTTSATATSVVISSFDQCESESDVSIWTASGGEAYLAARSNYCSAKYDGGCGHEDAECISSCFEENYGYTAQCAACFGSLPLCTYTMGCMEACMADGTGEDCAACNAPCVLELNECTGLPGGGADDGDDAATTAAPTAATTATTAELDGITAGPSSSAVGGAPAPAVTASPAPQGGTTTAASPTTATPTAVCGADEEGCVDVDYVIRYCIPASEGPCPCPEGMTRCPTHDWGTYATGGFCQRACCDDGPDGTEVACPASDGSTWQIPLITSCAPIAQGCGDDGVNGTGSSGTAPPPSSLPAPSSPGGAGTTAPASSPETTYDPTPDVGGFAATLTPAVAATTPSDGSGAPSSLPTAVPTPAVSDASSTLTPTIVATVAPGGGATSSSSIAATSPVPTALNASLAPTGPIPPQENLGSSSPRAASVAALVSTTGILATLLYLS